MKTRFGASPTRAASSTEAASVDAVTAAVIAGRAAVLEGNRPVPSPVICTRSSSAGSPPKAAQACRNKRSVCSPGFIALNPWISGPKRRGDLRRPLADVEAVLPEECQGDPIDAERDAGAVRSGTVGGRDREGLPKVVAMAVPRDDRDRVIGGTNRRGALQLEDLILLVVRHGSAQSAEERVVGFDHRHVEAKLTQQ